MFPEPKRKPIPPTAAEREGGKAMDDMIRAGMRRPSTLTMKAGETIDEARARDETSMTQRIFGTVPHPKREQPKPKPIDYGSR